MIDLGSWAETLGLRRKKTFVERMQDAAEDVVESVVDTVKPVLTRPAKMARSVKDIDLPEVRMPDVRLPKMSMPDVSLPDMRLPRVHPGEMVGDAAGRVRQGAESTGAAAVGVAAGIGGFFAAIFSWIWSVTMFFVKAGLLVGVAYAGWQWLQSRKTQDSWNRSSSAGSDFASSTYGTVNAGEPAPAGAR
jgi:hypothetical protein